MTDEFAVVLDDRSLAPPETRVGTLFRERSRGSEVISFAYDPDYAAQASAVELGPDLPLVPGRQYAPPDGLFGIFRDGSPDRWGRILMERREAHEAKQEGRTARALTEWDFLAGVDDLTRHGALRLMTVEQPTKYVDDRARSVPPLSRLRELEALARKHEQGDLTDERELDQWLSQLVAPGSSLGGARPKASYRDEDGSMWIAKFPSTADRYDQAAWERLAALLAHKAGIETSQSRLLALGSEYRTFATRRFDRPPDSRRLYCSAMTLLGRTDGDQASYLQIAEAIALRCDAERIEEQLIALYRRIVLSILVGNRDDHLRNHGFLRDPGGWVLSPVFDINPNPHKTHHALNIDESDPSPSVQSLRSTRAFYRLSESAALDIEEEVRTAVRDWADVARSLDIPKGDQVRLEGIIDAGRS